MKISTQLRGYLPLLFLLIFSLHASAQTGIVVGKISDAKAALVGATVYVAGEQIIGTNTDINGDFSLNKVPAGEQTLVVTYLSYETQRLPITVKDGEVTEINVTMNAGFVDAEEVIISAQRRGQTQAINQQLSSDKIASIVSSDRIQELPDVNAAEAIGRLPGVSLNRSGGEGQKVVIRGMEPKFSAITVNGVRLPSNSSTDRSVDLSLISPELLDAIEVYKSPLPDMDAEAVGGTVNLRLRKAPQKFRMLAKGLGGYNDLAGQFKDYKGVLQMSNRFLNNKLGVIAQGSVERFNRAGDFLSNGWRSGRLDSATNTTEILGNSLRLEDRQEIRKRYNGSLSLDYELSKKHSISLFSLYSRTDRDQFRSIESYNPSDPAIGYTGQGLETELSLYSVQLAGDHNFGKFMADWSLASSQSKGQTPYDYEIRFSDTKNDFDDLLNQDDHPRKYFAAASPNLTETNLVGGEFVGSDAVENTITALVNFNVPFRLSEKISAEFKFGGKYYEIDRERNYDQLNEDFYYLGGTFATTAAQRFRDAGGTVNFLTSNPNLIGISTFFSGGEFPFFVNEQGEEIRLNSNLDPDIIRNFFNAQRDAMSTNRFGLVNRYKVNETITAGYGMFKLKFGTKLTVIPGFRYEYSNNQYDAGYSTVNGRYGVNGDLIDTTTYQKYGEFLPHLHAKYQIFEWLDVRASYAHTLARPDFAWVTPRTAVNNTALSISSGNPNLRYAKSKNYDLHFSAYKGTLGLLTIGGFYKDITNTAFPWTINLVDPETAEANGHPGFSGYELTSYTNLNRGKVYGYEIDLQTNLGFLPKPFNGIVINANYARLYSETQAFFTTSQTVLVNPFPPVFETTYTTHTRDVAMLSQSPHIFHMSVGYDIGKFSARISSIFQGTKASGYTLREDFDRFDLQFWRWDASVKQGLGKNWSTFLNLNNLTNQQDISFTRDEEHLNTIQTFGFTGTVGLQFSM